VYKDALSLLSKLYQIKKAARKEIILIGLYEHIGDIIACEPVVTYARENFKDAVIVWASKNDYCELVEAHPQIDHIFQLNSFAQWIILKRLIHIFHFQSCRVVDLHISGKQCTQHKMKLVKPNNGIYFSNYLNNALLPSFSIAAGLDPIKIAPRFYLNQAKKVAELPTRYVVVHTSSNAAIKDWQSEKWIELANKIADLGYHVIEVGVTKNIETRTDKYLDFTGKKSLQQIAHVIASGSLFIGVDSGFAHLANALNIDGIVMIGEYKLDGQVYKNYIPYTGKYKDDNHILFAKDGPVNTLECDVVYKAVVQKLDELNRK
jgi:ADP-heptose:LPS heptosyltransferase